jgi:flagellar hook-length control protein FliK
MTTNLATPLVNPLPTPLAGPAPLRKDTDAFPAAAGLVAGSFGATDALTPLPASAVLSAGVAQTPLLPMTAQAWMGSPPVTPIDSATPAPVVGQDAVRLTLAMPAPEITKRLAQMSGTGKETTWAALLASGPAAKEATSATETVTLDLPAGYDLVLLASSTEGGNSKPSDLSGLGSAGAPLGAAANTSSAAGGDTAGNAQAQADHRAQQFQQLADQMGQVAAQRLIAQIERGQWKMQMRMQPGALGNINVELDMHAGGLDALFSTDNALTRELMAQGSNKLRDTLTQSGMTVASVSINGEQNRQSGGNSTPDKGRDAPAGRRAIRSTAGASVAAPQSSAASAADGLNVLA